MADGQKGMAPYHTGSGIAHDLANFLSHFRLITMDRTVAAGCLVFLKRTIIKPQSCVLKKFPAFLTEFSFCMVMVPAVDTDHVFYGLLLSFHAGMHAGRNVLHGWDQGEKLFWYLPGRIRNNQLAGDIRLNA